MGSPVTHWQILSTNPDRTAAFYQEMFDWRVTLDPDIGYRQIDTQSDRGIPGGIWPAPPEASNFVQLFIEVTDIDHQIERALGLGARVLIPPQRLPEGGQLAVLKDPEGVVFGIHEGQL